MLYVQWNVSGRELDNLCYQRYITITGYIYINRRLADLIFHKGNFNASGD